MMSKNELAAHFRSLIGQSVEVEYTDASRKVGAGPLLLIGVTETSTQVWIDYVEGWSFEVRPTDDLTYRASEEVDPRDQELFADCFRKGYYQNLPLNDRLRSFITLATVGP